MTSTNDYVEAIPATAPYFELGAFNFPITTSRRDAQIWFNRGIVWAYSFHHMEAVRCFQQVIAHDASCAMGYWGVAYSSGPNYNKKWSAMDKKELSQAWAKCYTMSRRAAELKAGVTEREAELIGAMVQRIPVQEVPADFADSVWGYANAMRKVYQKYQTSDMDIATLAADALMNTNPWNLFKETGEPDTSTPVLEIKNILETALTDSQSRSHPGILHFYIHLIEMSSTPENALVPANYLRNLAPDAGHVHHMPSHIDVLCGDYARAIDTNMKATIADDKYFAKEGACNFYSLYRLHNYHSLIFASMMAGQSRVALESVARMEATIPEDLLLIESPPMAKWMEFFMSTRVHVLVRFGMWEELKRLPVPENQQLYCSTAAMTYYGRALAWAATGFVDQADQERENFRAAAAHVPS